MNSNLNLNYIKLQILHDHYVARFVIFKMKEKFTQMLLYYFGQMKSLQQTVISYDMKILTYERLFFMKKRDENVKKHCIYMTKMKLRIRRASLVLRRSHERVSASPPQKKHSVNTSLLYKIKSFR
jgi:hypothetical protein